MRLLVGYAVAAIVTVLSLAAPAVAEGVVAPEIDASTVSAGLGLLTAGVLIVRSRRRK